MRIVSLLLLFVLVVCCGQKELIESFQKPLIEENTKVVNSARDLMVDNQFDSAATLLIIADSLARETNDLYTFATINSHLGWMAEKEERLDSALNCYLRAIELNRSLEDSSSLLYDLNSISTVFRKKAMFSRSAESIEEAIIISILINDSTIVASGFNKLGNLSIELLDYDKGLPYYEKAAIVWKNQGKFANHAVAIHNQGDALRGMNRLEEALDTYKRALKLKRDLSRTSSSAYTLTGMGRTYLLMDSIDRAQEVLQEAINIRSKLSNKNSYAESLLIMSRVSLARGQYSKAERQLNEVERIARGNNKADLLRDAFEDQRTLYRKWGKFAELAEVDELYDIMTDSLYREEKLKVQEAQAAANLQREQQRTEIAEQNVRLTALERDAARQRSLFGIIVAILAILGLLVIGWQLLQIRKRNATLIALNNRIKLITDNAFHSQKNALGLISAMMRSKARHAESKEELEVLQDVEGKIDALGGVSKYLFQRRIEDNTAVSARIQLKSYLEELVEDTFSSVASNADLDIEVDDIETTSTEALNVGLITNEAVTNFSKYAESQGAETLMIRVLKKAEKLFLTFIDDGPGFPDGFDFSSSTGFGMQMMANLVSDMEGSIQLKREDDLTQIDIRIPLKS